LIDLGGKSADQHGNTKKVQTALRCSRFGTQTVIFEKALSVVDDPTVECISSKLKITNSLQCHKARGSNADYSLAVLALATVLVIREKTGANGRLLIVT
jgi:hypothetical protein